MKNFRVILSLLLIASLAWGCNDDPGDDPQPQPDVGLPDVEEDASDNNEIEYPEVDVWAEGPSDDFDTATPFNPGQSIGGVIETGDGEDYDLDIFAVELEAGTIFSFEFTELGPGMMADGAPMAYAVLQDEEGDVVRSLDSEVLMGREVFIPYSGTYYLAILDVRAGSDAHGGPTSYYAMETATRSVTAEATTAPGTVTGSMADGTVQAYEVTADEAGVLIAETIAMRPPVESELDTILYGWDPVENALVAFNDDIDVQGGVYDSQIALGAEAGATYLVIIDGYDVAADANYNLVFSLTDDHPSYPRDLEVGSSVDARINAAVGDESDADYFWVELEAGQVVQVDIEAADQLDPVLIVYDSWGYFLGLALAIDGKAAITFSHDAEADEADGFYVIVEDRRNIALEEGETTQQVGGEGFDYTISAQATEWTSEAATFPVSDEGTLAEIGAIDLFALEVPARALVHLDASSEADAFNPYIGLIFANELDFFTAGPLTYVHGAEAQTVRFGVRDQYYRGGAGYLYTPALRAFDPASVTFTDVVSAGGADTDAAQEINFNVSITGTLDGAGAANAGGHYFKLAAVEAGQIVVLRTEGAEGTDTIAKLLNADGEVLIENDDYFGQERSYDSAFVYDIETDGDYFLVIEPYCGGEGACEGNGDYTAELFDGRPELVE